MSLRIKENFDWLERLFPPEIILPIQMEAGKDPTPEELLMLEVVADAIRILFHRRSKKKEILEWIRSDSVENPFGFATICHHFKLDPEAVRERLLADFEAGKRISKPHIRPRTTRTLKAHA